MSLPLDMARCQGRAGAAMGYATLCGECIDCRRRTDIPEGEAFSFLTWMEPPAIRWWFMGCEMRIVEFDEQVSE